MIVELPLNSWQVKRMQVLSGQFKSIQKARVPMSIAAVDNQNVTMCTAMTCEITQMGGIHLMRLQEQPPCGGKF